MPGKVIKSKDSFANRFRSGLGQFNAPGASVSIKTVAPRADGTVVRHGEMASESLHDGPDAPRGLPKLGMEVCIAQADLLAHLPTAAGRQQGDGRWCQGIVHRKDDLPGVDA